MMSAVRSDLSVYDKNNQLVLAVEVTRRRGVPTDWAAQYRRNLFAHGTYPHTQYFLLAMPDKFFLWHGGNNSFAKTKPDYIIDAQYLLKSYLTETNLKLEEISEQSLALIVSIWLSDLIHATFDVPPNEDAKNLLIDSGLASAVKNGRYAFEEAA